jgi:hypothetical protein
MDLILKTRAIHKLRPNTEWILCENNGLTFKDSTVTKPTDAEIEQAAKEILADDAAKAKAKEDNKASAKAKLAALGLDADEISALLGV